MEAIRVVMVMGSKNLLLPYLKLLPVIITSGLWLQDVFAQLFGVSHSVLVLPKGCSWLALMSGSFVLLDGLRDRLL